MVPINGFDECGYKGYLLKPKLTSFSFQLTGKSTTDQVKAMKKRLLVGKPLLLLFFVFFFFFT